MNLQIIIAQTFKNNKKVTLVMSTNIFKIYGQNEFIQTRTNDSSSTSSMTARQEDQVQHIEDASVSLLFNIVVIRATTYASCTNRVMRMFHIYLCCLDNTNQNMAVKQLMVQRGIDFVMMLAGGVYKIKKKVYALLVLKFPQITHYNPHVNHTNLSCKYCSKNTNLDKIIICLDQDMRLTITFLS